MRVSPVDARDTFYEYSLAQHTNTQQSNATVTRVFLSQTKDIQVRLVSLSKFPIGVSVDMNGFLSLNLSPVALSSTANGWTEFI